MKTAQVNKLYRKLTPHEQAALAFEAMTKNDEGEIDAIVVNVERKTYQACHHDYVRRVNALILFSREYGIEYWKNRALMLYACGEADKGNTKAETVAWHFVDRIIALERVTINICNQFKVHINVIKRAASIPPGDALVDEVEANADLVKQYTEMFAPLLDL